MPSLDVVRAAAEASAARSRLRSWRASDGQVQNQHDPAVAEIGRAGDAIDP